MTGASADEPDFVPIDISHIKPEAADYEDAKLVCQVTGISIPNDPRTNEPFTPENGAVVMTKVSNFVDPTAEGGMTDINPARIVYGGPATDGNISWAQFPSVATVWEHAGDPYWSVDIPPANKKDVDTVNACGKEVYVASKVALSNDRPGRRSTRRGGKKEVRVTVRDHRMHIENMASVVGTVWSSTCANRQATTSAGDQEPEGTLRSVYGDMVVSEHTSEAMRIRAMKKYGMQIYAFPRNEFESFNDPLVHELVGDITAKRPDFRVKPWTRDFLEARNTKLDISPSEIDAANKKERDDYIAFMKKKQEEFKAEKNRIACHQSATPHLRTLLVGRAEYQAGAVLIMDDSKQFRLWDTSNSKKKDEQVILMHRQTKLPLERAAMDMGIKHSASICDQMFIWSPMLPVLVYASPLSFILENDKTVRPKPFINDSYHYMRVYMAVIQVVILQSYRCEAQMKEAFIAAKRKELGEDAEIPSISPALLIANNNPVPFSHEDLQKMFDAMTEAIRTHMSDRSDEMEKIYQDYQAQTSSPAKQTEIAGKFAKCMFLLNVEVLHEFEKTVMTLFGHLFTDPDAFDHFKTPPITPAISLMTKNMQDLIQAKVDHITIIREQAAQMPIPRAQYEVQPSTGYVRRVRSVKDHGTVLGRYGKWLFSGKDGRDLLARVNEMSQQVVLPSKVLPPRPPTPEKPQQEKKPVVSSSAAEDAAVVDSILGDVLRKDPEEEEENETADEVPSSND